MTPLFASIFPSCGGSAMDCSREDKLWVLFFGVFSSFGGIHLLLSLHNITPVFRKCVSRSRPQRAVRAVSFNDGKRV